MNNAKPFFLACIITLLALPSLAAAEIYIEIAGIPGEATAFTAAVESGEIEVLAWSWGVSAAATGGPSRPGADGAGQLRISKEMDKSTPLLAQAVAQNTTLERLRVTETLPRGDSITLQLDNVHLTGLEINGGRETLALDYGRITITYTPQRGTGEPTTFSAEGNVQGSMQGAQRRQGR